jgi:hypothetical protein
MDDPPPPSWLDLLNFKMNRPMFHDRMPVCNAPRGAYALGYIFLHLSMRFVCRSTRGGARTERPAVVTPPEVGVFFDSGLAEQQD